MLARIFYYPGPLWRLYSSVATLVLVLSVAVWGLLLMFAALLGAPRSFQTWGVRAWNLFALKLYALRVQVEGAENHDPAKPSLVVSNHQSLFDIPAAFKALSGDLRMVAKKELFSIPIFGWAIRSMEFIPVDRGNRNSGQKAADKIGARIRSGLHVWVAPEGTRSPGPEMGAFKKGSFAVAIESKLPIQPLLICNSFEACPKGSLLARPGVELRVRVLPRISSEGYSIEERGELAERVRSVMAAELKSPACGTESRG
jgi:1-acyl-sn-glycerol-3-phosphate acyltransferase